MFQPCTLLSNLRGLLYDCAKQQGFSYHGYLNGLVFNILDMAECFSSLGDRSVEVESSAVNRLLLFKLCVIGMML